MKKGPIFLQIILSVILIVGGYIEKGNWTESKYSTTGYITLFTFIVTFVYENYNRLGFYFQSKVLLKNTDVRVSISYLYRIKVENEYLLVKSRTRKYFQPVGGCYKTLPGCEKIFEELDVIADRKFETEKGIAKNDLRVHVKGENLIEFLKWFDSKEDREISPWREFCEELIATEILEWRPFRYIDYKFKKKIQSPIIDLDMGGKGLFIYEVFDLVIIDEQMPLLKDLKSKTSENYIWVTDEVIQTLGHETGSKSFPHEIGPHTKYAQNLKWSK